VSGFFFIIWLSELNDLSIDEFNKFYGQRWNWTTNEVNITRYMKEGAQRAAPYESLFTMGMRGDGDCKTFVTLLPFFLVIDEGVF
jgi:hypothetical protein